MNLEEKLLADKSFQHILKFAPESQRELMTFELARYFGRLIKEETVKARIDELGAIVVDGKTSTAYGDNIQTIHRRIAQLQAELEEKY